MYCWRTGAWSGSWKSSRVVNRKCRGLCVYNNSELMSSDTGIASKSVWVVTVLLATNCLATSSTISNIKGYFDYDSSQRHLSSAVSPTSPPAAVSSSWISPKWPGNIMPQVPSPPYFPGEKYHIFISSGSHMHIQVLRAMSTGIIYGHGIVVYRTYRYQYYFTYGIISRPTVSP